MNLYMRITDNGRMLWGNNTPREGAIVPEQSKDKSAESVYVHF